MNTKIKCGILAFAICIAFATVAPVTIGSPGEDPNLTIERLRQDPNLIRGILHRAVENAKKGDRKEIHSVIQSIGKPYDIYTSDKLLPDYISFLNDKDGEVQVLGATRLCSLKSPKSVDALVKYLQSKDFGKMEKMISAGEITEQDRLCYLWAAPMAIMALGEIGDKSVIPFLESLRSIDFHLEWGWGPVEKALAKLGALKSLSSVPAGVDDRQIGRAVEAIQGIEDPNLAPELMATVRNKMVALSIRCAAMYALGGISSPGIAEFLFEVINDSNCPEGLRLSAATSAVTMVSRTKDPIVEKRLLVYAENPSSNIRPNVLLQLAICMPDKYLGRWFETIMDTNEDPEFRNKLVGMEGATFPSISIYIHDILEAHRDLLYNCLNASDKNGRPMEKIRVETWLIINKILHEEPPLELMDEKLTYDELRYDFEMRFRRENINASADEIRRMVDEKIKSIVVKWQPQKESEKP